MDRREYPLMPIQTSWCPVRAEIRLMVQCNLNGNPSDLPAWFSKADDPPAAPRDWW